MNDRRWEEGREEATVRRRKGRFTGGYRVLRSSMLSLPVESRVVPFLTSFVGHVTRLSLVSLS